MGVAPAAKFLSGIRILHLSTRKIPESRGRSRSLAQTGYRLICIMVNVVNSGTNLGIGSGGVLRDPPPQVQLHPSSGPIRFSPVRSFIRPVAEGGEGVCAGKSTLTSQRSGTLWRITMGEVPPGIASPRYPSENPLPCLSAFTANSSGFRPRLAGVRLSQLKPTRTRIAQIPGFEASCRRH